MAQWRGRRYSHAQEPDRPDRQHHSRHPPDHAALGPGGGFAVFRHCRCRCLRPCRCDARPAFAAAGRRCGGRLRAGLFCLCRPGAKPAPGGRLDHPLHPDADRHQRRLGRDALAAVGEGQRHQPPVPGRRGPGGGLGVAGEPGQQHEYVPGQPGADRVADHDPVPGGRPADRLGDRRARTAGGGADVVDRPSADPPHGGGFAPALQGRGPGARTGGNPRRRFAQALRGRNRQRLQDRVPGEYEPRAAHAAQRYSRLLGDHRPGMFRAGRQSPLQGLCRRHPFLRRPSSVADQRPARHRQDRGRAHGHRAPSAGGGPNLRYRAEADRHQGAGEGPGAFHHGLARGAAALCRRAGAEADSDQPGFQRGEVHAGRRPHRGGGRPGARRRFPDHGPGQWPRHSPRQAGQDFHALQPGRQPL